MADVQFNMVSQEAETLEDSITQQPGAALDKTWTVRDRKHFDFVLNRQLAVGRRPRNHVLVETLIGGDTRRERSVAKRGYAQLGLPRLIPSIYQQPGVGQHQKMMIRFLMCV